MLIVLTTVPVGDADTLGHEIVNAGLAACVQVLPAMTSFYAWKGKVEREKEHLLLIKTHASKYEALERFITEHHTYDVPEIVAIRAEHVADPYRAWLDASLEAKPTSP